MARPVLAKLGYGLFTAAGVLLFAELVAHRVLGDPPPSHVVERVAPCSLREEDGRAWMECGTIREDMYAGPVAKGARKRVVVLGGSSVRDPFKPVAGDNFPEHLQARVPEVEVQNLGKAGMSMSGVAWITSQLATLEPDLVVLYEGHNDFAQMVFRGEIRGTRLWTVPLQRVLARSWLHAWLALPTQGTDPLVERPTPRPVVGPARPAACDATATPSTRRGALPTTDDIALRARPDVEARYRDDVRSAIRASPAPVVVSTLLRNFDHPPSGALVTAESACALALPCLTHEAAADHVALAAYAEAACGADAAITWWHRAHVHAEAGRSAEARDAWRRSLALDPVPLRAPLEADTIVREVAAEEGARVLDLEPVFGPMPEGRWFTDTLHPSTEGAEAIAAALEPVVRELLR